MAAIQAKEHDFSRRSFVKGSSLGAMALASGGALTSLFGCSSTQGEEDAQSADPQITNPQPVDGEVMWGTCTQIGCGACYCPMRFHVADGEILYVEGDNTGSSEFGGVQARACLRGRSIRRWINSPDRLQYPMKRVGKRGEGKFEQISWDEAIDLMAEKLKYTIDTYGNEAIFSIYSSGYVDRPFERLCNFLGGRLNHYGTDSLGQLMLSIIHMYGLTGLFGSALGDAVNSDLVLMFGNSPADTRLSGGSGTYDLALIRASGAKIVNIDYRMNESCSGHPEEWLPIRSGTDAALASAMAYVLITEGFVDEDFVNKYCIGYDESTMPEGSPEHSSYKDYILGTGYDKTPKTPEWAAPITLISADKITELARELGQAENAFIVQGWGPQRHSNGETVARAIAMLSILSGNIGRLGTSNGMREPYRAGALSSNSIIVPHGTNPIETSISCISMIDAIDHGEEMTALHDGVTGAEKLNVGIKFLMCDATNILNQRGDFNHTHDVLTDESKCEFIVVSDLFMTPTATYADLLLPGITRHERVSVASTVSAGAFSGAIANRKIVEPKGECRHMYDVCADVAEKLGVKDEFTEGRTLDEWQEYVWDQAREQRPDLPTFEELLDMGVLREETPYPPVFQGFIEDPEANPLMTPSGKIEVYSQTIAGMAMALQLDDPQDVISPIPIYDPGHESYNDCTEEFPLYLSGWHPKGRIHSTYANIDVLSQAVRHQLWINPVDADARGIKNEDMVSVTSPRGEVHIEARVTPRIMPGIIGMPEGAWHDADMDGDRIDKGGNINTLCSNHLTPMGKHNPSNSNIAQVKKINA